jgi:hypothetical protein
MKKKVNGIKTVESAAMAQISDDLLVWLDRNRGAVSETLIGWNERWLPGALEKVLSYSGIKATASELAVAPKPGNLEAKLHWDFPVLHVEEADPFSSRSKEKVALVSRADALLVARTVRPAFDETKREWSLYYYKRFRWFVIIDPTLELLQNTMKRARLILEADTSHSVLVVASNAATTARAEMLAEQGMDVVILIDPESEEYKCYSGSGLCEEWEEIAKAPTKANDRDRLASLGDSYPEDAGATLKW